MLKGMENCASKQLHILCPFWFDASCALGKMCRFTSKTPLVRKTKNNAPVTIPTLGLAPTGACPRPQGVTPPRDPRGTLPLSRRPRRLWRTPPTLTPLLATITTTPPPGPPPTGHHPPQLTRLTTTRGLHLDTR